MRAKDEELSMPTASDHRPSILFVGEAVTLSHIGRPAVLAAGLDPTFYRVSMACDAAVHNLVAPTLAGSSVELHHIDSFPRREFAERLAQGSPIFDARSLDMLLDADHRLLSGLQPDLVVGDFRPSLSISARRLGIPYMALVDGYWSHRADRSFPIPEIPLQRILGTGLGQKVFNVARPLVFRSHTAALNNARRTIGLKSTGADLSLAYGDADWQAFPELPELSAVRRTSPAHRHIGPVGWEPPSTLPAWWSSLSQRPTIYLCLGSSGPAHLLPGLVDSLTKLPVNLIVATAGADLELGAHDNLYSAPYLPGGQVAARSDLVICNGGSTATQQALATGAPVLGIATNMDQLMNMSTLVEQRAGRLIRGHAARPQAVAEMACAMVPALSSPNDRAKAEEHRVVARRVAAKTRSLLKEKRFNRWIEEVLPPECPALKGPAFLPNRRPTRAIRV